MLKAKKNIEETPCVGYSDTYSIDGEDLDPVTALMQLLRNLVQPGDSPIYEQNLGR